MPIIGDTGTEFIVAEWYPDPEIIANEFFRLADDVENWEVPLERTKQIFIENTELHFETESDPDGNPWVKLDPTYERRRFNEGWTGPILDKTGAMRNAATSYRAWFIEGNSVFFNTEALPTDEKGVPYGAYHQSGTVSGHALSALQKLRHNRGLEAGDPNRLQLTSEEGVALNFSTGSGMNLPQRMFVGADEFAILEIEETFINWLNGEVEKDLVKHDKFISASGTTIGSPTNIPLIGGGFAVRGAGGRFVKTGP